AAFLARGEAEQRAYAQIEQMWSVSKPRRRRVTGAKILLCLLAVLALAQSYAPLRTWVIADHATSTIPERVALASGDIAHLDATTSLIDDSGSGERRIVLLEGAGFFDVETSSRPFSVELGQVTATALGTAFETSFLNGSAVVTVFEGEVEVRDDQDRWVLSAGDRLSLAPSGQATHDNVDLSTVAAWRRNRLIVDGMSFGDVAAIIDRRVSGDVIILDTGLAVSRVSGAFDLSDPVSALRALAATRKARVFAAPPFATILLPDK
ncbi:MAG: FecR domain-containing protein, partial [Pseudomonadota bacterium]